MSTPTPKFLLTFLGGVEVTRKAKAVLAFLRKQALKYDSVFPAVTTIAKATDYCRRTVQYALRELEAAGELSTLPQYGRRGEQTSNIYYPHPRAKSAHDLICSSVNNDVGPVNLLQPQEIKTHVRTVTGHTIDHALAVEIHRRHSTSRLMFALREYSRQVKKGIAVRNFGGWLRCALRGGWKAA